MKEITNYPIYLFEEPVLIPKTQEASRELLSEIATSLCKCETLPKVKARAFKLCLEYFQTSLKLNLDIVFQFSVLGQDNIVVEFILEDKESEFVEQLKKYNQIFGEKGVGEFSSLYVNVMRKKEKLSVEDEIILMFYYNLKKIPNFKEEVTEDNKFKITYQIGNPN